MAAIGTTVFHGLFALLLIFGMRSCGSGDGDGMKYMSLNIAALGDPDGGMTDAPPSDSSPQEASPQPMEESSETVETQDDSPVTAPKKTETKPKTNPTPDPKPVPDPKPSAAEQMIKDSKDKKGPPGGPPNNNSKPSGVENGTINGKGVLGGGGGNGSGYEFSFSRDMAVKPSLSDEVTVDGSIKVKVVVDKNGRVLSATAQTNTAKISRGNMSDLTRLAELAAKSAKFDSDPNAGTNQIGYITITLKLK